MPAEVILKVKLGDDLFFWQRGHTWMVSSRKHKSLVYS